MPASCVANGCKMRSGTNKLSQVKFYKFPSCPQRRKAWVAAVRRQNWQPTKSSTLCSHHFITGRPSKDPEHPDWVPSIFPQYTDSDRRKKGKSNRSKMSDAADSDHSTSDKKPKKSVVVCSRWIQTDLSGADIDHILALNKVLQDQVTQLSNHHNELPMCVYVLN